MEIKVLFHECAICKKTFERVETAVAESGAAASVEKVTHIPEILAFGVCMTPAVVVDGAVKCVGKVPKIAEVKGWIAACTSPVRHES